MSFLQKKIPLGEIAELKSGGTPNKSKSNFWDGDFPWVSAKDLKTSIIVDSIDRLSLEGIAAANVAPKDSILILVRGMTLYKDVPVCLAGRDVAFNQDIKALIVSDAVLPLYLLYFLMAKKSRLLKLVDTAGHGTGRLDTDNLKSFPILVPPFDVQMAIAKLLSTWDQAIEKTEQLIAAKEKHLYALKQKLLTGKKRIKGYEDRWQNYYLSDLFIEHGILSTGKEPVYSVSVHRGLINQIEHLGRSFAAQDTSNYNLVKPGDIVYTKSPTGDFPYGIIKQSQLNSPVIVSPLYGVFTPKTYQLGTFLHFYFESPINTGNYLRPIIQKGAKNTIGITNSTFLSKALYLPSCNEETKGITIILCEARREIDLLKKQLEAYREQKRGLMQKLLTGQWRVKINTKKKEG